MKWADINDRLGVSAAKMCAFEHGHGRLSRAEIECLLDLLGFNKQAQWHLLDDGISV